jgi:hypothetical protein
MTQYKTITLELIRERPELYERLRTTKRLLPSMEAYATDLKTSHEAWKARLARSNPSSDPSQIAAAALELAIEELQARLPSASPKDEAEPMSLDGAMSDIRRHTPPA